MEERYYSLELEEIYQRIHANKDSGLTENEAATRLEIDGPNEIPRVSKGFIKIYLACFWRRTHT